MCYTSTMNHGIKMGYKAPYNACLAGDLSNDLNRALPGRKQAYKPILMGKRGCN